MPSHHLFDTKHNMASDELVRKNKKTVDDPDIEDLEDGNSNRSLSATPHIDDDLGLRSGGTAANRINLRTANN